MDRIKSESKLTFLEATSIIVGHGVGSGVLAVPYLASRNSWSHFLVVLVVVYFINLLLHLMIAELSLNNGGGQFLTMIENELFRGRVGRYLSWIAFAIMGFSVLINITGFISGGGAVFSSWLGLPTWLSQLVYYLIASFVVYLGMKAVGICEKISVFSMVGVVAILFAATMMRPRYALPNKFISPVNVFALFSMVSFSLSAVMSVPQVVKGVDGDEKKIKGAIALGTAINISILFVIAFMTLVGVGAFISQDGALVDISKTLGGWVGVIGYIFSLLALSTSFWANTLNLRDIISEKTGVSRRVAWFCASFPCLLLAVLGLQGFVGFARIAGVVQVLTGVAVIIAYNVSRRRIGKSSICGIWGTLPFQVLVIISSIASTLGALVKVI